MHVALAHMRQKAIGGTERYMDHLARHLVGRGHEVTIVCRTHEARPHPSVRFKTLKSLAPGAAWRMWAFARALERHVRRSSYDLVFGLGKTWTHDVVRLGGGCHGTYLAQASTGERGEVALKDRLALAIERRTLAPGAFRRVIVNSDMVRRDVVERHGIPADCIETICNGVDLDLFNPRNRTTTGRELRRLLGFTDAHFVVLFLGNGFARKGLATLLDAFAGLRRQRPTARLLVVGTDSSRALYEARADHLGLTDDVRFLGPTLAPETFYAGADLYVLPTHYDAFANSTLEALASGLPVITTETNGAGEMIEVGLHGAVLSQDGGLEELERGLLEWSLPGRARGARDASRGLAERHGIETKMQVTSGLLEAVAVEKALA